MMQQQLTSERKEELFQTLKERFENNKHRHSGLQWDVVHKRLLKADAQLWSLNEMEVTGGEPDVVFIDGYFEELCFVDCASESPKNRRSLCYDKKALDSRKENKPKNCVIDLAEAMGIKLLNEEQYRALQKLEKFDCKTSSWIYTPYEIRDLGGALFCDYRYDKVFTYHNGAESYYAARGFRGLLKLG